MARIGSEQPLVRLVYDSLLQADLATGANERWANRIAYANQSIVSCPRSMVSYIILKKEEGFQCQGYVG